MNARPYQQEGEKVLDKLFENSLKLCAFEAITDRLLNDHLITHDEAVRIRKKLSRMQDDQVRGSSLGSHARDKKAA